MTDVEIIGLLKTYVNKTLVGGGALKGKNCTIDSIAPITGGNRVTFKWTLDDGTVETGHLDVMNGLNGQDGEDGKDGKGIRSVSVNAENHLIITYSDGTTTDAGQIEIHSAVDSVNGQTGTVVLDAEAVGALPANTPIPSKTSDLTNNSGFITKAVNDLVSYYLKSETYSKTEVDDIVTAIKNSRFEVVATLPTTDIKTNVIYLVPKNPTQVSNVKDEYINLNGTTAGWEKIGDTEIDLSGYVTTEALNTALADYVTSTNLTTILADYVTETDLETALAEKQDTLTFDNAPTANSDNPVKSGGVYADEKAIYEVMGKNGAKNLIPYPYYNESPRTTNGITFTVNADGSVTASGTASADAYFRCTYTTGDKHIALEAGVDYILSGTGNAKVAVILRNSEGSNVASGRANDVTYSCTTSGDYDIILAVDNGTDLTTPLTIYPMFRYASDTDNTYQPYAKTNQQLTAENQTLTNKVANITNPNLLDNPWFTVNQRGYTTGSAVAYTVDRWMLASVAGTVTVTVNADKSITFAKEIGGAPQFVQFVEPDLSKALDGKTVTLSAIVDNVLYSDTFVYENEDNFIKQIPLKDEWVLDYRCLGTSERQHMIRFLTSGTTLASNITVKAVKLEIGNISTLAMDTAPNYATELAKCQRYYVRYKSELDNTGNVYRLRAGYGMSVSASLVQFLLFTPVEMRTIPTIKNVGIGAYVPEKQDNLISITDNSLVAIVKNGNVVNVRWDTTGLEKGYIAMFWADGADHYIELSADL